MRRSGAIIACGLLLATNLYVLVGVAWNRSGEPDAELVLTERELTLPYRESDEETGLALKLEWGEWGLWRDQEDLWFDKAKLEEIGFDCSFPPGLAGAPEFYRRQVSRKAWIVLEYDGTAFQERLDRLRKGIDQVAADLQKRKATSQDLAAAKERLQGSEKRDSRLIPVDAGRDAGALRTRYPDRHRYLIVPASVRASVDPPCSPDPMTSEQPTGRFSRVAGMIDGILTDQINVPLRWRPLLTRIRTTSKEGNGPRYAVTLRFGRRREPWIAELRPLQPDGSETSAPASGGVR